MRAFDIACAMPWAIQPAALQFILEVAAREHSYDPEAVAAKLGRRLDNTQMATHRDGVAILPVLGPIFPRANLMTELSGATSLDILARDFHTAMDDPAVKSVLFSIDSPGGQANGIHEFAEMVYAARKRKRIVGYVSNLGASAAYWIAAACSEIVLDAAAAAGSIGVVMAVSDPTKARAADIEFVSSQSPHKRPNPTTEAGRAKLQAHVDALADIFIAQVAKYRGTDADTVASDFGAGDILIGQSAVRAGMADRLGSFEGTLAEMAANPKPVPAKKLLPATPGRKGKTMKFVDQIRAWAQAGAPEEFDDEGKPTATIAATAAPLIPQMLGVVQMAPAPAASAPTDPAPISPELLEKLAKAEERIAEQEAQMAAMHRANKLAAYAALAKSEGFFGMGAEEHAERLLRLEETDGAEVVAKAIEREKSIAAALKMSPLLTEIGRSGASANAPATATAELERKAKERAAADGTDFMAAKQAVLQADPALAQRFRGEQYPGLSGGN